MKQDLSNMNVLVVDGKGQVGKLLRTVLAALGIARIEVATDTAQATAALRAVSYDAVFCDQDCAGANPPAFIRALRHDRENRNRAVPVILVFSQVQRRQVELLRDSGANDVLVAPLSAEGVGKKLRAALRPSKPFIEEASFIGPDRRRVGETGFPGKDRRGGRRAGAGGSAP